MHSPGTAPPERIALRGWQKDALLRFARTRPETFLAVACPGAGKTTFALAAIRSRLHGQRLPIVVVVPTQHLKQQWAEAALRFGIHLDHRWQPGPIPADVHGIVVTYAQAASASAALAPAAAGGFVVLDEIHHAANDRSWGDGVRTCFEHAECRLLLSGTPFRTDDNPIPFVRYSWGDYGDAEPDYEYGYGTALQEGGVVRPVFFPRFDGHMEWVGADGEHHEATFADDVTRDQMSARLRTALSLDGEWLPTVIDHAHRKLTTIRQTHPAAGGLAIAYDQDHARGIARLLHIRHGVEAAVALSDDPNASSVIAEFASSDAPWIVAVRMISEGVDIPRLRVGVYATTTSTAMFFRQAVGRFARWTSGLRDQRSYLYLPDDARLRSLAATVAQERRHAVELRARRREEEGRLDDLFRPFRDEEQMSLFAALSSSVVDADVAASIDDGLDPGEHLGFDPADLEGHPIDLPPPPPLPQAGDAIDNVANIAALRTRTAERAALRNANADLVAHIVGATDQTHQQVNAELNRRASVSSMREATIGEMQRRVDEARRWLDSL